MKISIVMATFNGQKYLEEQLNSFVLQTKLPDELVVLDDASSDNTFEILQNFKKTAPFDVRLFKNEKNFGGQEQFGYGQVFAKAASLACGDILFFSDQDDVWYSDKIETHLQAYFFSPVQYVVNDAMRVNVHLQSYKIIERENTHCPAWLPEFRIGCCCSVRRSFLECILPVPHFVGHDVWFALCASFLSSYYDTGKVLQHYRIHSEQASGSPTKLMRNIDRICGLFQNRNLKFSQKRIRTCKAIMQSLEEFSKNIENHPFKLNLCQERFNKLRLQLEDEYQKDLFVIELGTKAWPERLLLVLKVLKAAKIYAKSVDGKIRAISDFLTPTLSFLTDKLKMSR